MAVRHHRAENAVRVLEPGDLADVDLDPAGLGRAVELEPALAARREPDDAERPLQRPPVAPYDVAFLDPPYPLGEDEVGRDLAELDAQGWLVPGALVVVERSSRSPGPRWPDGFSDRREKRYGETMLWYGHAPSQPEQPEHPQHQE